MEMIRFKKTLLFALAVSLISFIFCACGKEDQSKTTSESSETSETTEENVYYSDITSDILGGWVVLPKSSDDSKGANVKDQMYWKYYNFLENGKLIISKATISDKKNRDAQVHVNVSEKVTYSGTYKLNGTKLICTINNKKIIYSYRAQTDSIVGMNGSKCTLYRDIDRMDLTEPKDKSFAQKLSGSWKCSWKVKLDENGEISALNASRSKLIFNNDFTCNLQRGTKEEKTGKYTIHGKVIYAKPGNSIYTGILINGSDSSLQQLNLGKKINSSDDYLEITDKNGEVTIWEKL